MTLLVPWLCAQLLCQTKPPVTALAFSPGGEQVLAASQDGLRVLSWPDLKENSKAECRLAHIHGLVFSPNRSAVLAVGGRPGEAGELEILSWPGLKSLTRFQAHTDLIYGAGWSPDGGRIVTGGADNTCTVFRWTQGAVPERVVNYRGHSKAVVAIAFLRDGKQVVSCSIDLSLQVWDAQTARQEKSMDNHLRPISDMAVRPTVGGQTSPEMVVTTGEDRTVRLWQPSIARLVRFSRLDSIPRAVRWSPTGDTLVVGCDSGRVYWLDPDSGSLESKRTWDAGVGRIDAMAIHAQTGEVVLGGKKGLAHWANPRP